MSLFRPDIFKQMFSRLDPENLEGTAFNLYQQIENTIKISLSWEIPACNAKKVLIIGMGGSAIGGELLRTFSLDCAPVPITVSKNYNIPAFVGEDTLCLVCSYSGNTVEALSSYRQCIEKGATVIAISTGGRLEKLAQRDGVTFCSIPGGLQPRAALAYSFSSLYLILGKAGILPYKTKDLALTSTFLKETSEKWAAWQKPDENPPLALASNLRGKIPVIYSSPGYLESMSYRWKCQFNENSKILALWSNFPELIHNEIVGWGANKDVVDKMHIIFLRSHEDPPHIKRLIDITYDLLQKKAMTTQVFPQGNTPLEHLFYFILFGDLLTIYSAFTYDKDPSKTEVITWIKKELSKV